MGRIGILGGTFDPIHLAHLAIARCARQQKNLDKVVFMPSKPPHKKAENISEAALRAQLVRLAIEGEEGFVFSDFELKKEGVSYTAETLSELKHLYPSEQFFFLLGGDSLFQFEHWYHPQEIVKAANILAVSRDGASQEQMEKKTQELQEKLGGTFEVIRMPQMEISSSQIRKMLAAGESVRALLPPAVYAYIQENHCYGSKLFTLE